MQNVSNAGKDSEVKLKEINMTKSVDNGEILTLDNESMSDKPFSKISTWSRSIEDQMIEFRKKKSRKIFTM